MCSATHTLCTCWGKRNCSGTSVPLVRIAQPTHGRDARATTEDYSRRRAARNSSASRLNSSGFSIGTRWPVSGTIVFRAPGTLQRGGTRLARSKSNSVRHTLIWIRSAETGSEMRTTLEPRTFGMFFSLLLLCSCATTPEPSAIIPASELPADVIMNEDAGRGGWLFVTIRLESGEELPFIVDTGSSWTLIDKSLEPKLGKRLGTMRVPIFGSRAESDRYAAPGLYMGSTRLLTGNNIYTSHHLTQLSFRSHQSIMGVIGMDCLKHYCIQLDFETRKMRFLDSNRLNPAELGRAFPLTFRFLPFIHHAGPVAGASSNWWLIDTGCNIDGLVSAPLFRRELWDERDDSISTNRAGGGPGSFQDNLWLPTCAGTGA